MRAGHCGTGLTADDLADGPTARQTAEMVVRGEGLDPVIDSGRCDGAERYAGDWLFDPRGHGARSGLPLW